MKLSNESEKGLKKHLSSRKDEKQDGTKIILGVILSLISLFMGLFAMR